MGATTLGYEAAGELLNFGAFLAFMGVNLAAIRTALSERRAGNTQRILPALVSLLGFLSCLAIWLNLPTPARRIGLAWMAIGVIYQVVRTRGFRATVGFAIDGPSN